MLAMLSYTFHSLSKKLVKCNLKELKRILRRLDYEEMIEAETEEDTAAIDSVKTKLSDISVIVSTDFQIIASEVDVESIEK